MLNFSVDTQNFTKKKKVAKIKKNLHNLLLTRNELLKSLSSKYVNNYRIRNIKKIVGKNKIRLIGMGGSILGTQAIYNFLKDRVKKEFIFIGNLEKKQKKDKNKMTNLIISKSGNTLETITNANLLVDKKQKNIFITENKKSYLFTIAQNLKSEMIHHNNFIGGRYSVLSEVGMLPAELMGLNPKKFRQLNNIIKNKNFLNSLLKNVEAILFLSNQKKSNSILLNYNPNLIDFLEWYKQLTAESLGKKGKGIFPIISTSPGTPAPPSTRAAASRALLATTPPPAPPRRAAPRSPRQRRRPAAPRPLWRRSEGRGCRAAAPPAPPSARAPRARRRVPP